jgi:hypothetical protein
MTPTPFSSRVERLDPSVGGMHVIPVPESVVAKMPGVKRVILSIDDQEFTRALQGLGSESAYVMIGMQPLKALGLRLGSELRASIRPDPEPDDPEIAPELLEALRHDEAANARWNTFTPGRKRSLTHHVSSAKRAETRERRAIDLIVKIREHRLHGDA